jgi:hypothetical protein
MIGIMMDQKNDKLHERYVGCDRLPSLLGVRPSARQYYEFFHESEDTWRCSRLNRPMTILHLA